MLELLKQLLSTLNHPIWQFLAFALAFIIAIKKFPYKSNTSWLWKGMYFVRAALIPLLSLSLIIGIVFLLNLAVAQVKPQAPQVLVTATSINILAHSPTPTHNEPVKIKVTPTAIVQTNGGNQPHPSATVEPKPTQVPTSAPKPTPTISTTYPKFIAVNYTSSCTNNYPSFIKGRINSVEITSSTEVIYSITYFNNSSRDLALNIYTMNLTDNSGNSTEAAKPSVYIAANRTPSRILCNGVQREGAKLSPGLTSKPFCYAPLHKIRDGIEN